MYERTSNLYTLQLIIVEPLTKYTVYLLSGTEEMCYQNNKFIQHINKSV